MGLFAFILEMFAARPRRRRRRGFQEGLFLALVCLSALCLAGQSYAHGYGRVAVIHGVGVHQTVLVTPFVRTVAVHAFAAPVYAAPLPVQAPLQMPLAPPSVPNYAAPPPVRAPLLAPLPPVPPAPVPLIAPSCGVGMGYGAGAGMNYGATFGAYAPAYAGHFGHAFATVNHHFGVGQVFVRTPVVRVRTGFGRGVFVRVRR